MTRCSRIRTIAVWIDADELFEPKQGDSEVLSAAGRARIDDAMGEFGEHVIGGGIVIEGYAVSQASGAELALSRGRASLVRNYFHARFHLRSQNIGTVPLRGVPPPSTHKNSWNGICIVVLSGALLAGPNDMTLDGPVLVAPAALAGSLVGACSSVAATFIGQRLQARWSQVGAELEERDRLYGRFVEEAVHLFVDSIQRSTIDPVKIMRLYSKVARIG